MNPLFISAFLSNRLQNKYLICDWDLIHVYQKSWCFSKSKFLGKFFDLRTGATHPLFSFRGYGSTRRARCNEAPDHTLYLNENECKFFALKSRYSFHLSHFLNDMHISRYFPLWKSLLVLRILSIKFLLIPHVCRQYF